jgi:hypothetical protein
MYEEMIALAKTDPVRYGTDFSDIVTEIWLFYEGHNDVVLP